MTKSKETKISKSSDIILVTDLEGNISNLFENIVFHSGPIYQFGHRNILSKNFFSEIITPYSKYKLKSILGD